MGGFDAAQATWNLLEQAAGPALAAANAAGVDVIVKEALANGRLTARGGVPPVADAARSLGTTTDALALAAVLPQPWPGVVLSGATTPEMLASNLGAAEVEIGEELLEWLGTLREGPERDIGACGQRCRGHS